MPHLTNKSVDTIEIHLEEKEVREILIKAATGEINKGHMAGNFKAVTLTPDGYRGFKIVFLKVDDKKFAEVEPLDF